jgi:membrane protease YdiL (CAAX protease family)
VKALTVMLLAATAAFFVMFSPLTKSAVPFWLMMPMTAGLLATVSLFFERKSLGDMCRFRPAHIAVGLLAAGGLYMVFWVGHYISIHILPFAVSQIDSIYSIREGQNPVWIALLLVLVIGPAEEIFWRGFVQRRFSRKYGILVGFIIAAAVYTLVHIGSFNLMLIAASAVCGGFWGLLYVATGNLWPCIISHAVWDVVIFIVFPIK